MILLGYERLQARKSYRLELQVPPGMNDKVSLSGTWRRYRAALSRVTARDSDEQGDDDLCGFNQPGSCAYADQYTAPVIGITSGAVS
jgi:hypothetical protein